MGLDKKPTVLVVEDEDWIRREMKRTFEGLGYHVIAVADAAEAEESARTDPPDVIVTEEEVPTLGALMQSVNGAGPLSGVPVAIINPDEEEGTRYGDIILLPDSERIETLLNGARL